MKPIDLLSGELETWIKKHRELISEVRESTSERDPLDLSPTAADALDFLFGRLPVNAVTLQEFTAGQALCVVWPEPSPQAYSRREDSSGGCLR